MDRALRRSAAALAVVAVVAACGDGDGGVDPTDRGRIEAEVSLDDAAAPGVTLRLFGGSGGSSLATQATGSNGRAVFAELTAGSYEVEVEPPEGAEVAAGTDARKSAAVTAGGTTTLTFDLVTTVGTGTEIVSLTSGLRFSPATLTIPVGTTVVWRNAASVFHTITPDGHSEWSRATVSQSGDSFSHTFNTPGTYAYFCEPHQSSGMTGVITVE